MTYKFSDAYLATQVYANVSQGSTIDSPDGSQWKVVRLSDPNPSDYQGMLVKNEATGQYKMVSRGTETEPISGKDLVADLQMGIGQLPNQVQYAREFLQQSKDYISDNNGNPTTDLSLTGHSLGGSITQVLGAENPDLQASTFNPYGVGNLIPAGGNYSNITNNVMAGDGVSVAPGSKMIGDTLMYTEPTNSNGDTSLTRGSHGVANFLSPDVANQNGTPVTIALPPSLVLAGGDIQLYPPGFSDKIPDGSHASTTPTGSGGGYMGTDGVYHLNINGTSTPSTASTTVLGNIGNVTQTVLGPNATEPVAIVDPVTGEVTGYRVTSFDGEGEVGGIRTVVTFNPDGSFRSGETQYLVDGRSISEPLDATTAAKIDAGMASANITVNINDGTPAQPATTEPPNTPTPGTLGTGPGSTGDILNNDSLQNPTYGGGDVDTPIISDDGYDPGTYIDSHDPTDVQSGDAVNGSDLASDQASDLANLNTATTGLNLFNTLVNGLQNWDNASDLARIQTAVTLYNQLNSLNGMSMPNMGGVGAGLSLYSAYQNGDEAGMVVGTVQLVDAVFDGVASQAIGQALGTSAANVVPILNLVIAIVNAEENPLGVVIAAVSIACPVCGIFLAFAQIIATKSPVSEGQASATFDESGNLIVNTDEDKNGGGSTANQWMQQLAHGAQLAGLQTPLAGAFAAGMPSVGYRYAPDELNNIDKDGKPINGYLTLNWTGQDGKAYSRHYLGNGESAGWGDMGDEGSMAEDFFELMQSSFELYPPLMYEQLDGGVLQLDYGVATMVHATNTQKYNGQAEHTHGGEEETDAAQDQAITIEAGDKRLVQDNSQTVQNQSQQTHATVAASSLHTVVNPVIAPIQTNADLIDVGSGKIVSNNSNGNNKPLGFVPLGGINSLSQEKKNATAAMIQSAEGGPSGLFGVNNIASTAMAAAAIVQWPNLASAGTANTANPASTTERRYNASDLRPWDEGNGVGNVSYAFDSSLGNQYAGNGQKTPETVRPTLTSQPMGQSNNVQQDIHTIDASQLQIGRIVGDAPSNASNGYLLPSSFNAADLTGAGADAFRQTGLSPDLILTAPKVTGELIAGTEDTGLRFSTDVLLSNDSTANAKAFGNQPSLRITSVGSPEHGQVALINGQVVFIPDANFHGTAKFSYTVTDQFGLSSTATASIFVESVNDAPVIAGESATAAEDNIQIFSTASLLANDFDDDGATDGQSLRIVAVQDAQHGTVTLANGQIKFVPDANYHGPAQFTYMVSDGVVQLPATVNLTITAVNDAPVTQDEAATGDEDVVMVYSQAALLANDSDVDTATDGDVLRISRVSDAINGTVSMDPNGDIRFVPDANFHGQASYTYWVSDGQTETPAVMHVTLDAVNDAPVATGETGNGDEDATLMFTSAALLANDSDADTATDGDVLRISSVGQAEHGMVFLDANGDVRFVPDANYNGPASYTYWVSDGHDGLDGVQPVPATVQLNILQVNDLPVVTGETIASDEDVVLSIDPALLLANDSDVDTDAALNQAAGARQTLTISAVSGAQHGTVALLPDGTVQFTPELNYVGAASFNYTVDDGAGGQVQTTAVLNLAPVNDAPDVAGETININEDEIQTISQANLLANDHDVDNPDSALSMTGVSNASHGTVAMVGNEVVFTPDLNYNGTASFSYTVSDGVGGTSTATVSLTINSVNDVPVVNDELALGKRDHAYTLTQTALLSNDTDVETPRANLTIVEIKNTQHGTATLNADHSVTFVPEAGYAGQGTFEYVVQDADGGQSTGKSYIDFSRVNVNPVAVDDSMAGYQDAYTQISTAQLLANDSDPDADGTTSLSVDMVNNAQNGTVSLGTDGMVRFTPNPGFYGTGSFNYRVNDGDGGTAWATGYVTVQKANSAPVFTSAWVEGHGPLNATQTTYDGSDTGTYSSTLIADPTRHWGGYSAYDPDGDAITFEIIKDGFLPDGTFFHTLGSIGRDVYTPSSAPDNLSAYELRTGGHYVISAGSLQYVMDFNNTYHGVDYFGILATDSHGARTMAYVAAFHQGANGGGGGCFPVAIDTKGDGIDLLKPEDSNMFADINKDGWRDQIGWVSSADAVLAFDANQDGKIDQSNEVSFTSYLLGAKTDLEGLAAFDTNGDGKLSNLDDQWSKFGLVQDANGNGKQDEGEFNGLDAQQIVSIDLNRQGSPELNNGNVVFGTATVTYADGHTTDAADVMFAGKDIALPTDVQALLAAENAKTAEREAAALIAAQEIAAKEAADKLAAEQLAIQQAKEAAEAAEALAAAQALEAQVQAEAAALATAQQAAALQAAAEAAAMAEQEAALADEAEIRRQALLFNQMANTSPADETPIAFVPNNDAVTGHVSDPSGAHLQAANDDQANTLTLVGTH